MEGKFSRRDVLKSLTAGTAGAITAASGGDVASPIHFAGSPTVGAQNQTHVVFWNWLDNPEAPTFPELIEQFEAEHPNIKIDWELGAFATQRDKVIQSFAAGAGPDAFELGGDWIGQLNGMGAIEPLDAYFDAWPLKDDVYPRVIDQFRYQPGSPGGVGPLYALPFLLVAHYLYYRKDWADEVGFQGSHPNGGPGNLDEFLELALAVTDPSIPRYGFAMRGGPGGEGMWIECGGSMGIDVWEWTDQDANEWQFTLDTEQGIAANTWYLELFTKHQVCPPSAPTDSFAEIMGNMRSGLTCMTYHHTMSLADLSEAIGPENLGVVPVPPGPDPADWKVFGGAGGDAISAGSAVKDAAFEWIAFIASPAFQSYWIEQQGGVPINPSLEDHPKVTSDPFVQATLEGSSAWFVFPTTPGMGEFNGILFPQKLAQALTGEITSEQMMRDLNEHLNSTRS